MISGSAGAATQLGLKRTTLQALVKRLGIERPRAGVDRPYGGLGGKPKPALRAPIGMVRSGDAVAIMDFHEVRLEHGGIKVGM